VTPVSRLVMDFSARCAYREKAWNNVNLTRLAEKIKSPLVLSVSLFSRHYSMPKLSAAHMFVRRPQVPYPSTIATHSFMGRSWFVMTTFMRTFIDFLLSLCIMEASNISLKSGGGYSNNYQTKYSML
jgi:hypothetical protein